MATPCLEIKTIGMMPTTEELQCKTESALTKMDLPVGSSPAAGSSPVDSLDHGEEPEQSTPAMKKPKKTVLPDDYDETSGNTPHGFEGTWREHNARLATDRPLVPGHTSTPSKPPGPFYVDTPPSAQ